MYNSVAFMLFGCLLGINAQKELGQQKNFIAVVNEYSPGSTKGNIVHYESVIFTAGFNYNADIIVFPERALILKKDGAEFVPEPKDGIIPYKNTTYDKNRPMFRISKAAAESKVYVIINLFEKVECTNTSNCPDRGYFLYDTNVAFDRQGRVISRYRKYNVYSGNEADKPDKPDLSTFRTDFGVTFGMFTGFDILFKTPAVDLVRQKNVTNIVFPNSWPGEYPFLTGVQVQDGWSYAMKTNVLASGVNDVENGCSGTGIYIAGKQKLSGMYEKTGSMYMYTGIPRKALEKPFESKPNKRSLNLLQDPSIPQSQGKDLDVNAGKFQDKICHSGLCCNIDAKYKKVSDTTNHTYRAVVFQGTRRFGANLTHEVAYCAVVLCTGRNCAKKPEDGNYPLEFEEIRISADFKKNALQIPSTLMWTYDPNNLALLDTMPYDVFTFERQDVASEDVAKVAMNLKSGLKGLVTFGIFGRNFN